MMQIPENIKFLGHEYAVMQVSPNDIEGNNGQTWLKIHKILIDRDIPQSRKESVLLHEIIEIVNAHLELGMEHRHIEALEETLYAVLRDNKMRFDEP
ncbi:MAG: hypothetical protein ACYC4H_00830 [Desulfocucumaceae bacterium]